MTEGGRPGAWDAVFFDLDGVLVDSQEGEILALLEFAERIHADVPRDRLAVMVAGRRMQESVELIHTFSELPLPEDAVEQVRELAERHLEGRLRAVPGVRDALEAIDLPKFVVSNSPLDMIRDRLDRTGLAAYFEEPKFSAYELGSWKPDPDLYAEAVRTLGLRPDGVVAIEDSDVGVRSARDAGLHVYHYLPGQPAAGRWVTSTFVFGHMDELSRLIVEGRSAVLAMER